LRQINELRTKFEDRINHFFPEPESSLLAGVTLGIKRALPERFESSLKATGTTHIVVVSGTNITLVLLLMASLTAYFNKRFVLLFSVIGATFYCLMVGFDPPVLRAYLMALPVLAAHLLGRETKAFQNLLLSAVIILVINPLMIFSLSFQLSFLATLGLIVLVPIFNGIIHLPKVMEEAVTVSLAAQVMTLPMIAITLNQFSFVSLLVNLLVIPIVPVLTFGGFLFICFSMITPFAQFISFILYLPLTYFVRVVEFFGQLTFSSITLKEIPPVFAILYYLCLVGFVFWNQRISSKDNDAK
jgi:competence protein ComEC